MKPDWGKIGKALLPIAPGLAKKLAKSMDGKKTITGFVTTVLGVGCLFIPGGEGVGITLLSTGIPTLTIGILHKIEKTQNKKEYLLMDTQKYTVKETAEALEFGVAVVKLVEALRNGVDPGDTVPLVSAITKAPGAIEGAENIPLEMAEVSPEEQTQLDAIIAKLRVDDTFKYQVQHQVARFVVELGKTISLVTKGRQVYENMNGIAPDPSA